MNTKHFSRLLSCSLAAALLLLASSLVRADEDEGGEVDPTIFYEKLAPYGTWVDHPQYHRVWYPHGVPRGWRPYTHGHWVHTHLHGWLWQSDWEWGWAPFHYGRWAFDDHYGWIWVPGSVWGPAWVAWRSGGNHIGWAPLPPTVGWHDERGLLLDHVDLSSGIAAPHWIFIEEQYFLAPHMHHRIYRPANNFVYVRDTQNITRFTMVNRHIVNQSLAIEHVERVTRQPVRTVHVRDVNDFTNTHHTRHDDHAVPVFRPRTNTFRMQEQPIKPYTTQNRPARPHNEIKEYHQPNNASGDRHLEDKNTRRLQEQPIKPYTTQTPAARPHKEINEHRQHSSEHEHTVVEDKKADRQQRNAERQGQKHKEHEQKKFERQPKQLKDRD